MKHAHFCRYRRAMIYGGVAHHLAAQMERGYFGQSDAGSLARLLAIDLSRDAYGLGV